MSMYRCAVCGSPNVQRIDRNDGFSYKKALVGTAVFGAVGAVAGINGKTSVQYACPDCGYMGSTAMNDMEKTMVDMAVSSSEEVLQRVPSLQAYMQKYVYLKKERGMMAGQADQSAASNAFAANAYVQSEYTLAEVRQAAQDFYDAFYENPWLCNMNPPYWRGTPIQNIAFYEKAFQAMRVIAYGLYAYPMLIVGSFEGKAFSIYNLKKAFEAFILTTYGPMSVNEMYKLARNDPYLSRTMDALIDKELYQLAIQPYKAAAGSRIIYPDKDEGYKEAVFGDSTTGIISDASKNGQVGRSEIFIYAPGYETNWLDFSSDDKRVHSWDVYDMGNYDTQIEFGYKLCNNSLYVASVDVVKTAENEHPEPTREIVALLKQKADKKSTKR